MSANDSPDEAVHQRSQWVQVAETIGSAQTVMVLKYLQANDLHAVAVESASIALITGANSVARVMVPEEEVGQAIALLEPEAGMESGTAAGLEDTEFDDSLPAMEKAVLGATALIFSPLGAGIAYILTATGAGDDGGAAEVECPNCGLVLELLEEETVQGWYTCPECTSVTSLGQFVICPSCETEVELGEQETAQGWFICSECRRAVRLQQG